MPPVRRINAVVLAPISVDPPGPGAGKEGRVNYSAR